MKKQIGLTVVVWEIVLLVAVVLVALGICKVAYPEPAQPAFGALADAAYNSSYLNAILGIYGVITGAGKDKDGSYYDVAPIGMMPPRGVRCYYCGLFRVPRLMTVNVVGKMLKPGQLRVCRTTILEPSEAVPKQR